MDECQEMVEKEEDIIQLVNEIATLREMDMVEEQQSKRCAGASSLIFFNRSERMFCPFSREISKPEQNKSKTRTLVRFLVCCEFFEEVKQFSKSRRLYIAHGLRCNGKRSCRILWIILMIAYMQQSIKCGNE